ncbi:GNAT family N-acetyltransferase [soil metagenome]
MSLQIRPLQSQDIQPIAQAFTELGWNKPASQYVRYLAEQDAGTRVCLVALIDGDFAGYLTVLWTSDYEPFRAAAIPEVSDFNVLPTYRRRRIGTHLMDEAEAAIAQRSTIAGIGVGMYPDYGAAQRLYVLRGYVPDGRGLTYNGRVLQPMEQTINDDDLVLYFTKQLA